MSILKEILVLENEIQEELKKTKEEMALSIRDAEEAINSEFNRKLSVAKDQAQKIFDETNLLVASLEEETKKKIALVLIELDSTYQKNLFKALEIVKNQVVVDDFRS